MSHYDKKILEFLGAGPADPGDCMDMNNPYDLLRAEQYVQGFCIEPVIIRLAAAGDSLSKAQTKHDMQHLINVRNIGMQMLLEWDRRFPGRLTEWQKRVIAPLSFLLHDIGRAIDVNNHAEAGARIAYLLLTQRRFPKEVIRQVCRPVALHRSEEVLKREFDDLIWAFLVLADKCVGDEDRVRPKEAAILRILTWVGLAHIDWWDEAAHDRVNYAITKGRRHHRRSRHARHRCWRIRAQADAPIRHHVGGRDHDFIRQALSRLWSSRSVSRIQLPHRVQRRALHVRQGDKGLVPDRHLRRADGLRSNFANFAKLQEIYTFPEFAGKTCQSITDSRKSTQ